MARQPYRQTTHRKDPVKQYKGAISKARGKHFEEYIDLALRYYEQKGEATIEKTPEPMRPRKREVHCLLREARTGRLQRHPQGRPDSAF